MSKIGTIDDLLKELPAELHNVVFAVGRHVIAKKLHLSVIEMREINGDVVRGLGVSILNTSAVETTILSPEVVVLSLGPEWHIAVTMEGGNSTGGWTREKADTDPEDVAKMVGWLLSPDSKD